MTLPLFVILLFQAWGMIPSPLHSGDEIRIIRQDSDAKLQKDWKALIDSNRFSDARKLIQAGGSSLSEEKRKSLLEETQKACRQYLEQASKDYLLKLEKGGNPGDIQRLDSASFDQKFVLPDAARVTCTTPAHEWCMAVRETLQAMRNGKDVLERLLGHVLDSLSLVRTGENGWYQWSEEFTFSLVREKIQRYASKAMDAPRPHGKDWITRKEFKDKAYALRDRWLKFETEVKKRTGEAKRQRSFTSLVSFPSDFLKLRQYRLKLQQCLIEEDPGQSLLRCEKDILKHRNYRNWDSMTPEYRQEYVRIRIAAGSLRRFYEMKTVDDCVRELRDLGNELKTLKGSFELSQFGPKVQAVFDGLRGTP